jgi:hypothetical protein
MTEPVRKIRLRDLVLIVAAAAIPMTLARSDRIRPFFLFAVPLTFLAGLASIKMIQRSARVIRRDRDRRAASGLPEGLTRESLTAIVLAIATPVVCLVLLLWSLNQWHDLTYWVMRQWWAIRRAGW